MVVEAPERIVLLNASELDSNEAQVQIQEKRKHEEDSYCCGWKRSGHWCGAFLTMLVILSGCFFVYCQLLHLSTIPRVASFVLLAVTYLVYLVEALNSGTLRYLRRFDSSENLVTYIARIRSVSPKITFYCECYHNETRRRTVQKTHRDANGNSRTHSHTESYTARVVTHRAHEDFLFDSWEDRTPGLTPKLLRHRVMRMDFSEVLTFADAYTENYFKSEWEEFRERHRSRDTHFNPWQKKEVPGFQPKMLLLVEGDQLPWFMRTPVILFCSVFLLSWPYRLLLDRCTSKSKFEFQKCIRKIPV